MFKVFFICPPLLPHQGGSAIASERRLDHSGLGLYCPRSSLCGLDVYLRVCVEGSDLKISLQAALSNNFPELPGFGCRLPRLAAYAEYRFPSLTLCPRLFGNEGQIRCLFSLPQMLLIGGAPRLLNRRTCFQALGWLRWLPSCIVAFVQ